MKRITLELHSLRRLLAKRLPIHGRTGWNWISDNIEGLADKRSHVPQLNVNYLPDTHIFGICAFFTMSPRFPSENIDVSPLGCPFAVRIGGKLRIVFEGRSDRTRWPPWSPADLSARNSRPESRLYRRWGGGSIWTYLTT